MKVTTTRFGAVEVPDNNVLSFPSGVLGFPEVQRYVMLDHNERTPLKWLQAVDRPELAFPLVAATDLLVDYHITEGKDKTSLSGTSTAPKRVVVTFKFWSSLAIFPDRILKEERCGR